MTQASAELIAFALSLAVATGLLLHWGRVVGRHTIRDRYKPGQPELPGLGGLALLPGWLAVIALVAYSRQLGSGGLLLIFTALACGAMGLADDLKSLSQRSKVLLPLLLGMPLALYIGSNSGTWAPFAVGIPPVLVGLGALLYLAMGTNLTNMHSGFNGLSTGNALVMLLATAFVVGRAGEQVNPQHLYALAGATAALVWFNSYPARVLEGNVASHFWGGALATVLLLEGFWLEGLVLFSPQLVDFTLWSYARLCGYPFQKYAPVIEGQIRPADTWKLKFLVSRYFPTERKATAVLWALQVLAALAFISLVTYTHSLAVVT